VADRTSGPEVVTVSPPSSEMSKNAPSSARPRANVSREVTSEPEGQPTDRK
jgi:hypothetical protein